MKRFLSIYIVVISLFGKSLYGQTQQMTLKVPELKHVQLLLLSLAGGIENVVDTAVSDASGTFVFNMDRHSSGVFRAMFHRRMYFDFVSNEENIIFSSTKADLRKNLKVESSKENELYFAFTAYEREYDNKMGQLEPMLNSVKKEDEKYPVIIKEFNRLQAERSSQYKKWMTENPSLYTTHILKAYNSPYVDPTQDVRTRTTFYLDHYFDAMSFDDLTLLTSNVYTQRVLEYTMLYHRNNFDQETQESVLTRAMDVVIPKLHDSDPKIFEQVVTFLIDHYTKLKFDLVLDHIQKNYLNESVCESEAVLAGLTEKVAGNLKVTVGSPAPELQIPDDKEGLITLDQLPAKYTLIVFWASWCPHCTEMLPKIKALYNKYPRGIFDVVAISMDTDEDKWKNFITSGGYDWHNGSDLMKWSSPTAKGWNVGATPAMFLIDENRTVVFKPARFSYLDAKLKELVK